MKTQKRQILDIPSDYPLPKLYYFSGNSLKELSKQLTKLISILNQAGFKECHFPFLVPRSILLNYKDLVPLNDYIKVYSGKDRRSYAYLRPDGIFSQGIILAGKIIKSYRDLPLKLFEVSPGYRKRKMETKRNIFTSPEESFSLQGGLFTKDEKGSEHCQSVLSAIFRKFSIKHNMKKALSYKTETIQYSTRFDESDIEIARLYVFNKEIARQANIYFFNKLGRSDFPYMYTFSLSQNILLLKILTEEGK